MSGKTVKYSTLTISCLALLYALVFSIFWSLTGRFNHDENQFMASAFMVFDHGLHPYRDFAYFHMPNLVYIYTPLFLTDNPMLYARLFNGICGFGICVIIFWHGRYLLRKHLWWAKLIIPICLMVLLVHSHMFKVAISEVWNHSSSGFFGLLAIVLLVRWQRNPQLTYLAALCGFSLGMAIGIRLSFAPLILPFLYFLLTNPETDGTGKKQNFLLFSICGLTANLPGLYFLIFNFSEFWFGNMIYPALNTAYHEELEFKRAMDFQDKIEYLKLKIMRRPPEVFIQTAAGLGIVAYVAASVVERKILKTGLSIVLLSTIFLLVGALAATPSQKQYYFMLYPLLLLISMHGIAASSSRIFSIFSALALLWVGYSSIVTYSPYAHRERLVGIALGHEEVALTKVIREAKQIRSILGSVDDVSGVLTLAPIYILNTRLPIYSEFVTGPFAWSVSHLLSPEQAAAHKLPLKSNIENFITEKKPAAILTGREKVHDIPLIAAARKLGYQETSLSSGNILWTIR